MIINKKIKIIENTLIGVDPFQPIEYIDITKDMVGYRIKFVWPKPKKRNWLQRLLNI